MSILHIDSSILGDASVSRQLTAAIVEALTARDPQPVVHRDLAAPQEPAERAPVEEFLDADTVVIGAPMYNFGIPHQLKAWIDSILVARRTFRYGADGPVGLAGGRRVIVVYASGGVHGAGADFVEPYLRAVFAFIGLPEITVLRVEGVNLSPEARERALAEALARVPEIALDIALKQAA